MSKYDDLHTSVAMTSRAIFTSMLQDGHPIQQVQMMANKLQASIIDALQSAGAQAMLSTGASPMHQQMEPGHNHNHDDGEGVNPFL
jgi:hypothetical protein